MGCHGRQEAGVPLRKPALRRPPGFLPGEGSNVSSGGHPPLALDFASMVKPSRIRSAAAALIAGLMMLLLVVPAAFAENGVGLAGPTTDKTVTFFCFGVILFFALLVIVMSLIQGRLEKRKEMRKSTLSRLG